MTSHVNALAASIWHHRIDTQTDPQLSPRNKITFGTLCRFWRYFDSRLSAVRWLIAGSAFFGGAGVQHAVKGQGLNGSFNDLIGHAAKSRDSIAKLRGIFCRNLFPDRRHLRHDPRHR